MGLTADFLLGRPLNFPLTTGSSVADGVVADDVAVGAASSSWAWLTRVERRREGSAAAGCSACVDFLLGIVGY